MVHVSPALVKAVDEVEKRLTDRVLKNPAKYADRRGTPASRP
jgi:hypothetical protein